MVKCGVKICMSRSEKDDKASGVTFHKVPKDQKRREEWIKNIRLLRKETDWLPSRATVICSKHFEDRDKIPPKHDKGRIRLSDKAVPMVTDETESPMEMEVDLNVESDEEIIKILETPRKHKMRKTIKRLKFHKIIIIKDKGGLCYPTQQVFDICISCEAVIRLAIAMSGGKSLNPNYGPMYLATKTLEKIQTNLSIREFAIHSAEHVSSLQMDHSLLLINAIIHKYIKIRLYHESKMFTLNNKKESKRQLYNKLMLHSGV